MPAPESAELGGAREEKTSGRKRKTQAKGKTVKFHVSVFYFIWVFPESLRIQGFFRFLAERGTEFEEEQIGGVHRRRRR